jgi:hypothetical protein
MLGWMLDVYDMVSGGDGWVDVVVCVYEMVENMYCGDVCSVTMRR